MILNFRVYQPITDLRESPIRSDEGLPLETSAPESLYGGQFTISTQLITETKLSVELVIVWSVTDQIPVVSRTRDQLEIYTWYNLEGNTLLALTDIYYFELLPDKGFTEKNRDNNMFYLNDSLQILCSS